MTKIKDLPWGATHINGWYAIPFTGTCYHITLEGNVYTLTLSYGGYPVERIQSDTFKEATDAAQSHHNKRILSSIEEYVND